MQKKKMDYTGQNNLPINPIIKAQEVIIMDKAIEFVLEQQGKALQRKFDKNKDIVANKLQLDTIDKCLGTLMHISIANWGVPMVSDEPLPIENIVKINESDREIVFLLMKKYWRVMNVRDSIDFHKEDNSVVLQLMCYEEAKESFGFSVYSQLVRSGCNHYQTQDWFAILEQMVKEAKQRVWEFIKKDY